MSEIRKLEPGSVWNYFHEITQIPRPSKKEKRIIQYMKEFGEKNNLETHVDSVGNVIIKKPATPGMENRKGVILQTHLDMVPQKNSDKVHDFENDPIETVIDGEWVKANGTTLGSDNGIGVAATMAVLASKDIQHGPVEGLFTIDEETGMTGVHNLKGGLLNGEILMNLDSEDEDELCVGCAGGIDVSASKEYAVDECPAGMTAFRIFAKGLKGGHSGVDIAMGRANSNKLMFRFLMQAESDFGVRLAEAWGGDLRNAIPRESWSVVIVNENRAGEFGEFIRNYEKIYRKEYSDTEPDLVFYGEATGMPAGVMNKEDQFSIIRGVYVCPNGVVRMSQSIQGLVETSNNLAIVRIKDGKFEAHNLTRSSVDTAKEATAWQIAAAFHLAGADVKLTGGYPGWKPDMSSPILGVTKQVFTKLHGKEPGVKAIHAGLECGLIQGVYPGLDMISFGPTIKYPHSPDEKVHVPSVGRFWNFLVEILKNVPNKN
jgi:dipeptidase D